MNSQITLDKLTLTMESIQRELIEIKNNQNIIFSHYNQKIDELKINYGIILSKINESMISYNLKDYEFKVFSQWGEDGIIQHLIR